MPNWTYNTLTASKSLIEKYTTIEDGDRFFDFNKVIKMPPSLEVTSGSQNNPAIITYLTEKLTLDVNSLPEHSKRIIRKYVRSYFSDNPVEETIERVKEFSEKELDECYELGKIYVNNIIMYGHPTWYEWSYANWGTKWNAADCSYDPEYDTLSDNDKVWVSFSTAWSMPFGIIEKILEDNPKEEILLEWINEDYDGEHYLSQNKNGEVNSDIPNFLENL